MSWDLWEFCSISMNMCVAFKVTVGRDWEYPCNEIYYRLGSVWFGKRVLFTNFSMHLALTRPSEVKWEFQSIWSGKSGCPCIWKSLGMFILKLEKQLHWSDAHTDGSDSGHEIWDLFGWIPQKALLTSLWLIQAVWTSQTEERKQWAG